MRKSASIILLFILLFNIIGYRVWFFYAERSSDAVMEARLDNDEYNGNELISLTIPLYNPYQVDQKSFERVNGEITYQGKTYKFVKRMVSNGNLVLLCIPDNHKMLLKKAKTDYGNSMNDLSNNGKNQRSGTQKSFSGGDYTTHNDNWHIGTLAHRHISIRNDRSIGNLSDPHIVSPGKPPQFIA